jgi:hypothetical protein
MKKIALIAGLLLFSYTLFSQVGISTPNPAATLDIVATNPTGTNTEVDGLLMPRIDRQRALSMAATPTSTLIYVNSTATGTATGTAINITSVGFYFFDGTVWQKLTTGINRNWELTGNTATNPTTNFLGTTDAQPLIFRTNNSERARIFSDGRVSINNSAPFAVDQFTVSSAGSSINGYTSNSNGYGNYSLNSGANGTGSVSIGNNSSGYSIMAGSGSADNGSLFGNISFGNDIPSGWGIAAAGNFGNVSTITGGGGGSFSGNQWGVLGNATISGSGNVDRAAFVGRFNEGAAANARTVYLGARLGGVNYKVLGTGSASVSTTMPTRDGERILFAPEAPENWFFDIGEVTLVNGKAIVRLDPIFIDCISDSKPFKVFVQGGENTLGSIRISRNQIEKTFVLEDLGGNSNGTVQYSVYAIWKQKENVRFPKYTQPFELHEEKRILLPKK